MLQDAVMSQVIMWLIPKYDLVYIQNMQTDTHIQKKTHIPVHTYTLDSKFT